MALIDRINMEYGHLMEPDLRLRGLPDPSKLPPMTPAPGLPAPTESEADRLYAALMGQQAKPSLLSQVRNGVQVPSTRIVHGKQAVPRLFLRGLISGFKSGGAGGPSGSGAGSLKELMQIENIRSQIEDRRGRLAETKRMNDALDELRRMQAQTIPRDDDRQDKTEGRQERAYGLSERKFAWDQAMDRQQLALARSREARLREADRVAKAGENPKWPESWKMERAATIEGLKARLAYSKDYTANDFMRDLQAINDTYAEREFRLFGGQTGSSTTAPVKDR